MDANEIKAAQTSGKIVCIVDLDRAFDVNAARDAGVNVERLLVSQPDGAGQASEIAETVVRTGAVDIVVVLGTLGARPVARIRDYAQKTGTVLVLRGDAEPLPKPIAEQKRAIALVLLAVDRDQKRLRYSRAEHTAQRVGILGRFPETRPAYHGLSWAINTGRFASELEEAVRVMRPAALVAMAVDIATSIGQGPMKDVYDAWRTALLAIVQKTAKAP